MASSDDHKPLPPTDGFYHININETLSVVATLYKESSLSPVFQVDYINVYLLITN